MSQAQSSGDYRRLRISTVEKVFMQITIDLKIILILDGIDQLEDLPGFRIRFHDPYSPFPDILIHDTGDRYPVLDRIQHETAKLTAMVRVRQQLYEMFRGCRFLLPTSTNRGSGACWIALSGQDGVCRGQNSLGGISQACEEGCQRNALIEVSPAALDFPSDIRIIRI